MPGGGIVGGSAILIGSELGIGKSTLMLQMMHDLAEKGLKDPECFPRRIGHPD